MSAPNDSTADANWKPNGRPQSTLARDFSAALDDLFKLNGIGALEQSVVQKKDIVQSQQYQLEDLDAKLREADQKLKRLEATHRRQQSQLMMNSPRLSQHPVSSHYGAEDSSGESDAQGRSSPR